MTCKQYVIHLYNFLYYCIYLRSPELLHAKHGLSSSCYRFDISGTHSPCFCKPYITFVAYSNCTSKRRKYTYVQSGQWDKLCAFKFRQGLLYAPAVFYGRPLCWYIFLVFSIIRELSFEIGSVDHESESNFTNASGPQGRLQRESVLD